MRYRITVIENPPGDRRPRYRGTGFNPEPGGMTEILTPPGHVWGVDRDGLIRSWFPTAIFLERVKIFLSPWVNTGT